MADTNGSLDGSGWKLPFDSRKIRDRHIGTQASSTISDERSTNTNSKLEQVRKERQNKSDRRSEITGSNSDTKSRNKDENKSDTTKVKSTIDKQENADEKSGHSKRSRRLLDEGGTSAEDVDQVKRFEIVLQNNHGDMYHPGQYIEGHVVLDLQHPLMARGIFLHFRGHGYMYWTETRPGGGTRCIDTVEFEAMEDYFNVRNILREPGFLDVGTYELPFRFHLTPPTPDTYSDNLCEIVYFLEARVKQDTLTRNDIRSRRALQVVTPLDLNTQIMPDVTLPVLCQESHTFWCWCCSSRPFTAFMRLPRTGYAPGETIVLQADIENKASRGIKASHYRLVQERVYKTAKKTLRQRDVVIHVKGGPVSGKQTCINNDVEMQIPKQQLFNVTASRIFSINYILEMFEENRREANKYKHSVIDPEVQQKRFSDINVSMAYALKCGRDMDEECRWMGACEHMEVIPWGSLTHLQMSAGLTLGSIPLKGKTLDVPTHLRLAPHAQIKPRTVIDIETEKRRAEDKRKKSKPLRDGRERRKVRNKRVTPTEETDDSDYVIPVSDRVANGLYMR